jgi:glucan biosynthesis protein C
MIALLGLRQTIMTDIKSGGRRHDLDALRVLCFGTLIIYHTSLAYGTRTWLLNSIDGSRLVDLIAAASHPWRMSLLFFISGLVTRSLLRNRSVSDIRGTRTRQLLLPFTFGVLLVVPPQIYLSEFNPFPGLSYWEFWKAFMVSGLTLEHLWFLAYLWIYVFAWSFLWPYLQRVWPNLPSALANSLRGVNLFLIPILLLSVLRLWLYPIFGETRAIHTDIYAHLVYFSMFMAGSLLMEESTFWREVDRQRWLGGALAIISFLVVAAAVVAVPREDWPDAVVILVRIARSIFQWCAIIALLGFAGRIANRPNRVIAFLNRSMMTYYVAHQTVIIIVAHQISKMGPLDIRSFVPVVLLSTLGCGLIGEAQKLIKAFLSPLIARVMALIKPPLKTAPSGATAD